ncbi:c-type cytochrome [Plastoroseomonas hellenica]|uniref:c-type cytochrome n=1 Tax=Plastoroseomonas hellenica TaxID=2687306 RepID=UPI001BABD73A|nr:cytochrome c [Plastoroseomonas hellenica]MBR0645863.1 cytochrome c [Plastoroseomonas hellenica]
MRALLIAGGLLAMFSAVGAAIAQPDVINARREGLRGMGREMEAMKAIADSRGDPRPAAARIEQMTAFFQTFPTRFPEGSGTPTGREPGQTGALPAVWSDNGGFQRAAANMVTQLGALRAAATAGDPAGFATAFQQTGATCGACHRAYRAR